MTHIKSIIAMILSLSLCACSNGNPSGSTDSTDSSASSAPAEFSPESAFTLGGTLTESTPGDISLTTLTSISSKNATDSNPILSNIFCADPTAVEYEGRLYIYGTNDHQQYEAVGPEGKNTYEHTKSIVMISTDDMVNYTYHGIINVGDICPWAIASWAPSITSRRRGRRTDPLLPLLLQQRLGNRRDHRDLPHWPLVRSPGKIPH